MWTLLTIMDFVLVTQTRGLQPWLSESWQGSPLNSQNDPLYKNKRHLQCLLSMTMAISMSRNDMSRVGHRVRLKFWIMPMWLADCCSSVTAEAQTDASGIGFWMIYGSVLGLALQIYIQLHRYMRPAPPTTNPDLWDAHIGPGRGWKNFSSTNTWPSFRNFHLVQNEDTNSILLYITRTLALLRGSKRRYLQKTD